MIVKTAELVYDKKGSQEDILRRKLLYLEALARDALTLEDPRWEEKGVSDTHKAVHSPGTWAPHCSAYFVFGERKDGVVPDIRAKFEDRCT